MKHDTIFCYQHLFNIQFSPRITLILDYTDTIFCYQHLFHIQFLPRILFLLLNDTQYTKQYMIPSFAINMSCTYRITLILDYTDTGLHWYFVVLHYTKLIPNDTRYHLLLSTSLSCLLSCLLVCKAFMSASGADTLIPHTVSTQDYTDSTLFVCGHPLSIRVGAYYLWWYVCCVVIISLHSSTCSPHRSVFHVHCHLSYVSSSTWMTTPFSLSSLSEGDCNCDGMSLGCGILSLDGK